MKAGNELVVKIHCWQAEGCNPDMNATGKSDSGVVSVKRTNKGAQPDITGQPPAESVEKSPGAKGNPRRATTTGTPRPEAVSSALDRVREAAKKDSKQRFTSLLHHVTVDLLRASYYGLKRNAATGIDGITWSEYGEKLEEHLPDVQDRIQSTAAGSGLDLDKSLVMSISRPDPAASDPAASSYCVLISSYVPLQVRLATLKASMKK